MPKVTRETRPKDTDRAKKTSDVLKKMREHSIEEEASAVAQRLGLSYVDLHVFPASPEDVQLIPEADSRRLQIAVFLKKNAQVRFAIARPEDPAVLEYIRTVSQEKGWESLVSVASLPSVERTWHGYERRTFIDNLDLIRVSLSGADLEKFENNFKELISLKENRSISTTLAMEIVLAGARKLEASDVHIEPEEERVRLRYRIDGVLQDIGMLPQSIYHLLLSRIKMIGGMRLNIRDRAQDGHYFVQIEGKRIDVRVNIIPGKSGESINMRLLSNEDVLLDVSALGLRGLAHDVIMKEVEKSHGMILNTGPTGSGKTTTLYTLIHRINKPGIKIITVEDPVEYSLPGIVQTEVSKDKDYTFATALRAIVRQDPDVILVGEIRDEETADISVNAALTGHLVFSTLHTNSAPAAIPRFIELGVKPSLLSSSINVIIGQRLVRKLCLKCREAYIPAQETKDSLIRLITIISPKAKLSLPQDIPELWKAVGCAACHFTGYKGRLGIFEIFKITTEIEKIINNFGSEEEIFQAALEDGMVTMTQDGILKALEGITTLDEVWRVSDQTETLQNIYEELMPSELTRAARVPQELIDKILGGSSSLKKLSELLESIDSQERFSAILAAGLALKAADVHIEPQGKTFTVRLRLDGILKEVASFPINEYPSLMSAVKLLGGLKSGERAGVVDSRFSIQLENPLPGTKESKVDVRLSIILGGFGETVEMRLLNQSVIQLELEALELRPLNLERLLSAISRPNGLILNTGPTGSGKTTTLYSILARLNKPEVKIITVEDPIEYQIPGLLQTQVNETEGYTFSTALRSLLRQNPNILMIGEIRDEETASIAIQAAATGHLVFSTLHTNSAASAVPRLLKMGIGNDDLANTANLFMAQRLVRRLCKQCKKQRAPTTEEKALLTKVLATFPEKMRPTAKEVEKIWDIEGCEACNGTGYEGEIALAETLIIDQKIQELIARGSLAHEIETQAIEGGMLTLIQDGILSLIEGKTSFDEVKRVTDL
ncbi:MAG: GspE/PulE family protein [Candidatus Moraniibacteriota bacterium]